jgi:hypothetical protein
MKFFSTALAAFAVGSAMAAPVLEARTVPTPCPCSGSDKSGVEVPNVDLPTACNANGIKTPIKDLPSPDVDEVNAGGDEVSAGAGDVVVVVKTLVAAVLDVEAKVHTDLDKITAIIGAGKIDTEALLKIIVNLQGHLEVLQGCVPTLDGLVIDANVVVAADLEVVLDLVVRVQALIADIDVCLQALVVLDVEILAVIGAKLNLCLGLIVSIATPIVDFALALVAKLTVIVDLKVILGEISDCAGKITNTCDGLTGLLAPVLALLGL